MAEPVYDAIVAEVVALFMALAPEGGHRAMYGGTVFELEPGNPKSRIGGVYAYEGHVSVEFAHGARLDDPRGCLEGSGKARRHIKLRSFDDIEAKACAGLLQHAIALARA